MLGDIIGNAKGKITGSNKLSSGQVEVSFEGEGKFQGVGASEKGSYTQSLRSEGVLYADSQVSITTKDGDKVTWTGFGIGFPSGPGITANYAHCGTIETDSPNLAHLRGVAAISQCSVKENGDYTWTFWSWTPPEAGGNNH